MQYIGIDLGTTNSAIASYDGEELELYKSPEQHDVTPSALFFDKRGNKYVGARAYLNAARSPDNAAILFKRMMGTSTPVRLTAVDRVLTPEECSAEVLRTLYGYLPEEVRLKGDTATVITVPAAFNQMQKDATLAAAEMAGIGQIALMQEPVAAVMSVMRERGADGTFLVFDIGGGTLDIAIAESIRGRVSLLAHGGIEMCGGRDFDRALMDSYVKPWLHDNFSLALDFAANPKYRPLLRMAAWATERAKIELARNETATVALTEAEIGLRDENGEEIYLDVQIDRDGFDRLIAPQIEEAVASARRTLEQAGLTSHDVERVVFVGGPSQYKPLRDKVAFELGIAASTDVNPMTAVAEGAAVFAESIDWSSERRGRKGGKVTVSEGEVTFSYASRTPENQAKLIVQTAGSGGEIQADSVETGWTSGRRPLSSGAVLDLPLSKAGSNAFRVLVFDRTGNPVKLAEDQIIITRTAASVDAIPASHTISVEALSRRGGSVVPVEIVHAGDPLPKKGSVKFKADQALSAGSPASLNFKLWEGEIKDPITDNNFIGVFEIRGQHIEEGIVPVGADLICEYEVADSGNITLEVSIPAIGGSFHSQGNLYSRQAAAIDYSEAAAVVAEDAQQTMSRLEEVSRRVDDSAVDGLRSKLEDISKIDPDESDPEATKEAMDAIHAVKRELADLRQRHLRAIREIDLERVVDFFEEIRHLAKPVEVSAYDNLLRTARRVIDSPSGDFEAYLDEMRGKNFDIMWRQDWFVVDRFNHNVERPHLFREHDKFEALAQQGRAAIAAGDMGALRRVVSQLDYIKIIHGQDDDLAGIANIVVT